MKVRRMGTLAAGLVLTTLVTTVPAQASHSWGTYHWARTSNPLSLKLGDSVGAQWDAYLSEASSDWSASSVINTTVVAGSAGNLRRCAPPKGRVEVCNTTYGNNGWLGVAGITVSGGHITSAYVKLNDTYFNSGVYNSPEWRRMVMCQEIGHAFGLDHQDEAFDNANLGTCMDYTNNPLGPPDNQHPNRHDYDQLETIYAHLDATTTTKNNSGGPGKPSRSRASTVDRHGNGTVTWTLWIK